MSETSVIPRTRADTPRTPSVLLSPSKKRWYVEARDRVGHRESSPSGGDQKLGQNVASPAEILRWTFTRAAIASCSIQDVFEMRESGTKGMEYFWLGRIPCRTVRLVGLLVGVQVWEKRTMYTLDDGTAVIDCAFAHPLVKPASLIKSKPAVQESVKAGGSSFDDYLISGRETQTTPSTSSSTFKRSPSDSPAPPKPVAHVGQSVQLVGRVVSRFDTRMLLVDEISPCASFNEESDHIITVSMLHSTTYYPTTVLPPFVPPPLPNTGLLSSQYGPPGAPKSPSKPKTVQQPVTPSLARFGAVSTNTSPSTTATTSSPASSIAEERQAPRLRHPSRLHTRDLTANTFRIYVKHYMDNAPPPCRQRLSSVHRRCHSPSPMPRCSQNRSLKTPIKSHRFNVDQTPRPTRSQCIDHTPHTPMLDADVDIDMDPDDERTMDNDDQMYGYTLSHLRRVPELSILARRVVKADIRRRAKEEHKKAVAQSAKLTPHDSTRSSSQAVDGIAVKRLFKQAIRTLFQEGDIVLWSGPNRPLPRPVLDSLLSSSSGLWKTSSSINSVCTTSSSRSRPSYEEWDDEVLTDAEPGEEAYVPLTPAYFSRVLEDAIRTIMAGWTAPISRGPSDQVTPKPSTRTQGKSMSLIDRLRAQEKAGPPPGPTKGELLRWLRNSDERWERVGEWTVEEALEWGRREGRLWCVGKGRWEVCG